MTTKYRIIGGFVFMTLLLVALGSIGYSGLQRASEYFFQYDRVQQINVRLSDMSTHLYRSVYHMEMFFGSHDPQAMEQSSLALQDAEKEAQAALGLFDQPDRRQRMEQIMALLQEYDALIQQIKQDMVAYRTQYAEIVVPSMQALSAAMTKMANEAKMRLNHDLQHYLSTVWLMAGRLNTTFALYAEATSAETAKEAAEALANMRQTAEGMRQFMTSEAGQRDFKLFMEPFENLEQAFREQEALSGKALAGVARTSEYNKKILDTVSDFNNLVMDETQTLRAATADNAAGSQNQMLIVALAGVVLGVAFAVLIIVSLVRVLGRMSQFAEAVARGDFAYDPQIREKGEIGTMVSALKGIPGIFQQISAKCNDLANNISCGRFRDRLEEAGFAGGFSSLARAINTVSDSYTSVLDNLPVSIMTMDTARKIVFLNVLAQKVAGGRNPVGEFCGDQLKSSACHNEQCFGNRCMQSRQALDGEVTAGVPGNETFLTVSTSPLQDLEGHVVGGIEIITDITQIRKQQALMLEVGRQASDISDRVAAASEQLAAQVEQISRGAEMQRERVESTASAMNEMNSTVLEVARNAATASGQSDQARENANSGAELVNKVVASINNVNQVAMKIQANMEELGRQAESIGGVMNVISDIADQTNLLALNAAIEAARAGEAGRGFAVVADEVRKLAEKTMNATREVGDNIEAIQNSARINIQEVTGAVQGISEATGLADASGSAIHDIASLVGQTTALVTSIATAAEEQSATSEEINQAIAEINQVVGETTEGMLQSSSAVQDLSRMAQELRRVMENLR